MGMIKSAVKWILIAFVVLIVLGVLFGGSDNQTTTEQTKSTTDTNTTIQPANTATLPEESKMMSPTENTTVDPIQSDIIDNEKDQVDKSELESSIEFSNHKLSNAVAGNNVGQYPQSAIDAYKGKVNDAQKSYENDDAGQAEVDNSLISLKEAEKAFDDTLITEDQVSKKDNTPKKSKIKSTDYDQLQLLYNSINENMGYNEVLAIVNSKNLPYSDVKYSEGRIIKVAFDEEVTPQSHAKNGDHVSIHFDEQTENKDEYIFSTMEYFNNDAFITIFQYERGTYWEFRDSTDEYKGLYINDHKSENEFEITYDNGNKVTVNWIPVKTKEEQFEYIFNHRDK